MDLSVIQKVSEMLKQGISLNEIREQLRAGGLAPEAVEEAITEAGADSAGDEGPSVENVLPEHHEKVIMPEPGFDPSNKS